MFKQVIMLVPNLLKLAYRLLRDHRIPAIEKIIFILMIGYVLFPLDLVPDLVPLAGQVDDVLLAALGLQRLLNAAGFEVASQNWEGSPVLLQLVYRVLNNLLFFLPPGIKGGPRTKSRSDDVIDAEYRIIE